MWQSILTMISMYLSYLILILLIPSFPCKFLFPDFGRIKRFFATYLLGNFIVIFTVYLLVFLKIYCLASLLAVYFLIIGGLCLLLRHQQLHQFTASLSLGLLECEQGVLRSHDLWHKFQDACRRRLKRIQFTPAGVLEAAAVAAVLLWIIFLLSRRALTLESFSAPDEEIHLQWIQSLLNNRVFHSGVYPFGMHNVVSALALVSGNTAIQAIKYFGVINSTLHFLIVYLAVKSFCKNPVAALLGIAIVGTTTLFSSNAFQRFQFPVPHEMAICSFIILACFLVWYLQEGGKRQLILFGMGFSLTLLTHFHTTIVSLIFCLCAGLVYLVHIFKSGKWKWLIACGLTAVLVGCAPIAVGLLQGLPFEQSMSWAVSVIQGDDNLAAEKEADALERGEEVPEIDEDMPVGPLTLDFALQCLTKHSYSRLQYTWAVMFLLCCGAALYVLRIILSKFRFSSFDKLPFLLFTVICFVLMVSKQLRIPILLYPTRLISYLFFTTCMVIAAPLDELYRLVEKWKWSRIGVVLLTVAALVAGICENRDHYVDPPFPLFFYYQTTGIHRAVNQIIDTYPHKNWTFVSAVTETSMVARDGYHYEWIDLLDEVEDGQDLIIPTQYVFFAIEKKPIVRFGWAFSYGDPLMCERESLDPDDAFLPFEWEKRREGYYINQRDLVMAKAMAYVQQLRKQYPFELDVYYEDSEVVVYRLVQNQGHNNLSVSYLNGREVHS